MNRHLYPALALSMLVGCSGGEGMKDETAMTTGPAELTITAHDFAFDMPDTVPSGLTRITFVNNGPSLHHAMILHLTGGKTLAALEGAMQPGTGAMPEWAEEVGGPNPQPPGGTTVVTEVLDPGNYAVICVVDVPDHVPHVMKGMAKPFVVTPSGMTAPEPTADVTMTLADYSFTTSAPLTAGHHVVRVENTAAQTHEVIIVKLAEGKTVDDLMQWGATYEGDLPGASMGGLSPLKAGGSMWMELDLTPGNYVLMCFVPDKTDGQPHAAHGMVHPFTIE